MDGPIVNTLASALAQRLPKGMAKDGTVSARESNLCRMAAQVPFHDMPQMHRSLVLVCNGLQSNGRDACTTWSQLARTGLTEADWCLAGEMTKTPQGQVHSRQRNTAAMRVNERDIAIMTTTGAAMATAMAIPGLEVSVQLWALFSIGAH